jgi:hypothetical protein
MSESDSIVPAGFRVIPGYPRYAIDENGTVLSVCPSSRWGKPMPWSIAKRLTFRKDRHGYYRVALHSDGRSQDISIHTLVLTIFVGARPDGMVCRHIDGNKNNNHVSNLSWGTPQQNSDDMALHGTSNLGERHGMSKLKAADVLAIRARAANGEKLAAIAKDFPVTENNISLIVLRRAWRHI